MLNGLGERQQQLLGLLQQQPDGLSVDSLSQGLGIAINAVRQHLAALERDGLVARGPTTPSGGRPQQLYVLTERARESFPRQYSWFSELLLDTLREQMGSDGLRKTLQALGEQVGNGEKAAAGAALPERVAHLAGRMEALGYSARVVTLVPQAEISAGNCVFHKLAAHYPEVCAFDLGLMARATGAEVSHEECMVRGGKRCRFVFRAPEDDATEPSPPESGPLSG